MLKLKKTSVKLQRASFSRIGILGVCFLVFIFINSCGFHLAEKKSWIGQAKSFQAWSGFFVKLDQLKVLLQAY